ncbi:MAG: hypothetical protein J6M27_05655 [Lachnospiraceae bacterium]|nr:hypothetical protein [Lachnospiraceae bacterium]
MIAVIDTETNWNNDMMSIGIVIAKEDDLRVTEQQYFIIDPECRVGGLFSNVLRIRDVKGKTTDRKTALSEIEKWLSEKKVSRIFAYNAKFDYGLLPELSGYPWYDIMRLAAYRQFNKSISDTAECCKTGRLKRNYGVEPIMRMLSGNYCYCEVHNAVRDAIDELEIMRLLGHPVGEYEIAKI